MSAHDRTFDPEPVRVRRMEVITGDGGRRTWSPEAKARILAETAAPDAVVSEVARRHGLRPQQGFGWRRAARQDTQAAGRVRDDGIVFASVLLDAPAPPAPPAMPETPTIQVQIGDIVVRVCRPAWTAPR